MVKDAEQVRGWPYFTPAMKYFRDLNDLLNAELVSSVVTAALAYFILPTDLIPDMLGGLGFADDMALLTAVIGMVSSHITPTHRAAAARALDKELPKSA